MRMHIPLETIYVESTRTMGNADSRALCSRGDSMGIHSKDEDVRPPKRSCTYETVTCSQRGG